MGLNKNGTRFLLYCTTLDVDFARTAMIGRQDLDLSKRDVKRVFESFGKLVDMRQVDAIFTRRLRTQTR